MSFVHVIEKGLTGLLVESMGEDAPPISIRIRLRTGPIYYVKDEVCRNEHLIGFRYLVVEDPNRGLHVEREGDRETRLWPVAYVPWENINAIEFVPGDPEPARVAGFKPS
jgi:hypothetical protein